jgi:hypothetical protein
MGGQACVFYGAAEFSRDLDLVALTEPANLERFRAALSDLQAEPVAVPPFDFGYLDRGHALHFRCRRADVAGLRIDVMSALRGVDPFDQLWARRTTIGIEGQPVDLLSLEDLVAAKKTQRSKDWPMIQRLIERAYFSPGVSDEKTEFLLRELRTPALLIEIVKANPEFAGRVERAAVRRALTGDEQAVESALREEETAERAQDRAYWAPLKRELELLRHAKLKSKSP